MGGGLFEGRGLFEGGLFTSAEKTWRGAKSRAKRAYSCDLILCFLFACPFFSPSVVTNYQKYAFHRLLIDRIKCGK